jgi:phage/plasmid-associated DNA primase
LVFGLKPPEEVANATEEYRLEQDLLLDFLNSCCSIEPEQYTGKNLLYGCYAKWSKGNENHPLSLASFTRKMRSKGFQSQRTTKEGKTVTKFLGVGITSEGFQYLPSLGY